MLAILADLGTPSVSRISRLAAFFACLLFLISSMGAAGLAGTTFISPFATVRISIIEEVSNQSISRAHVRLESDSRSYDGYSDSAGSVTFIRVESGEYHVTVRHSDFHFDDRVLTVGSTAESVRMLGSRKRLRAIASVQSRNRTAPPKEQRTSDDAQSSIAGGVGPALPRLSPLGTSAEGSILIHGHDTTTTNLTLNGASIFPNSSANQLGLLGSDAFQSAQAGPGTTAGGPDGTLALQTYDPTIDWQGILQSRVASFGSTAYGFRAAGTSGRIGMSFVHSDLRAADALDGRYYADMSGLFYQHETSSTSRGETATFRYGFDANHVAWIDLGELSYEGPLGCRAFTARLPCGFGPGNSNSESISYVQVRDQLTLERLSLDLHVFRSSDRSLFDYRAKQFFGRPVGFASATETSRFGFSASAAYLATPNRTISFVASGTSDRSTSAGTYSNPAFRYPPSSNGLGSFHMDVPLVETRKASLFASVGAERSGDASSGFWGANGSYRLTSADQFSVNVGSGRLGKPVFASGLSSPDTLLYDCEGRRATGFGPGRATPGGSKTEQYALNYTHAGERTSGSVHIFRDVDHGGMVNAFLPGSALTTPFPPNYVTSLNADLNLACGTGPAIGIGDVLYRVQGAAERTVTSGADFNLTSNLGDKAQLDVGYSLVYGRAYGLPSFLKNDSEIGEGHLLSDIPIHKLDTTLRYAASKSTTLLASFNFTGANNASRRTAFSSFDMGVRLRAASGDLVIGVQNVFNTNAGEFGRFSPFPYLAQPATPRTFSFRYRLALGQQNIDKTQPLSVPLLPNSNQIGFTIIPFERATSKALDVQTTSPLCGPENVQAAKSVLSEIRSYRDYVEGQIGAGNLRDIEPRHSADVDLSYIPMEGKYALRIALPHSVKSAGPFLRCAEIHTGDYIEAKRLKLYTPGWRERYNNGIFVLYYAPQVGIYLLAGGILEIAGDSSKHSQFPDARRLNEVHVDADNCPSTYQSAATSALSEIKQYIEAFYANRHPGLPAGFRIVSHTSKRGPWLEIRADEFEFNQALATCLDVPQATDEALNAQGISGAVPPSLNYAPGAGFYTVPFRIPRKS